MKRLTLKLTLLACLLITVQASYALSDTFYSAGEDLDFLMESKSTYVIEEIEYKLRRFTLYRELEDVFFNLTDEYPGILND